MLDSTLAYGLSFLFPAGDAAVGRSLRDHGEFARTELDFLLACGGGTGTLIDVGANIGAIALPFADARRGWRVLTVESSRSLAAVLSANALNNRLYNVEVFHAAAGPESGLAQFPNTPLSQSANFGAQGFHSQGVATEPVRMLRLDDLAPADTRLIKIDVEGFEPEVLKGAQRLVRNHAAIWIAEATVQNPQAAAQVVSSFLEAGYGVYWFYAPFATPASPKGGPPDPFRGDANVVALPPGMANAWNLTPVGAPGETRPGIASAYPYLSRYGF